MRVTIDGEKCQGHNRCYALAPELFDVDDYGNAVVIGDGDVAPELEDKARLAVANCPEFAIALVDTDVTQGAGTSADAAGSAVGSGT
jgi:ferredoxin